jgi:hypothetical protein
VRAKYLLPCTCGQEIPVEATQAGQQVRCQCGLELEVPTLLKLTRLKPAGPPAPATPRRARSAWGPRQRVMLIGLAIMAAGASGAGWELLNRPPWFEVSSCRPRDAVIYWNSLKQGVDRRMHFEINYTDRVNDSNRWLAVAGVVTALGLLTVGFSPLISKRRKAGGVVRPVPGKRISGPGRRSG